MGERRKGGEVFLKNVVDVSRIKELNTFNFGTKKIILGAATNYQKLFLDKKIRKSLKVLPQVSVWFADDQIRELATLEVILLMHLQQVTVCQRF